MSTLAKATLQEIKSDRSGDPLGEAVDVQFNPATMQVRLSNTIEGGDSRKRQTRQYIGRSSTKLSFDLIFDTAEETDTGSADPVSVRERTAMVEKFLLPKKDKKKEVPPKVRFHWGNLIFDGIISDLTIDFELFAPDGTPLRAKMSVSIEEQDPQYQFLESGPGAYTDSGNANSGSAAAQDTPAPGTPGSAGSPSSATDRTAQALEGESAADFARRMGIDPAKWRSLVPEGADPLSLPAGLEIDFDSSVSVSAGLSMTAGVEAGVGVSLESSLGLQTGARATVSGSFALTEAGGVSAGLDAVTREKTSSAAAAATTAFSVDSAESTTGSNGTSGASAGAAASATPGAGAAASVTRQGRQVDARATAYGYGVPLKPRPDLGLKEQAARGVARGDDTSAAPTGRAVRDAPWKALPANDPGRKAADLAQERRGPTRSCGCRGSCSHGRTAKGCGS